MVESRKLATLGIDHLVNEALDYVWGARAPLVTFASDRNLTITVACSILITKDRPVLELLPTTVGRLAEIKCLLLDRSDRLSSR